MLRRALVPLAPLLLVGLVAAGCGSDGSTGSGKATTISITIKDGTVTPNGDRVQVGVGDPITFEITSDVDEELHVHSTPEHEYEIAPGSTTERLTIDKPGIVDVELHHLEKTVVQLEVR
jgi:plastocyanin